MSHFDIRKHFPPAVRLIQDGFLIAEWMTAYRDAIEQHRYLRKSDRDCFGLWDIRNQRRQLAAATVSA